MPGDTPFDPTPPTPADDAGRIVVKSPRPCPDCDGTGWLAGDPCPLCSGLAPGEREDARLKHQRAVEKARRADDTSGAEAMSRDDYVRRVVGWLVDNPSTDPITREKAWKGGSLDGVYDGESAKIRNLVRLAFLRGVIRGAGCAWEARQPIVLRALPLPARREEAVVEAARALCDAIGDTMPNNAWGWNLVNKRDNLRAALAEAARPAPVAPSRGGEAVAWGVADCDGKIVDADVYRDRCEAWVGSTSPGAPFRVVALVPKEAP